MHLVSVVKTIAHEGEIKIEGVENQIALFLNSIYIQHLRYSVKILQHKINYVR
jgi:hypothetical protein